MRLKCLPSLIQVAKPVSLLSQRRAEYWPGCDMASRTQQQSVERSPVSPEIKEPSAHGNRFGIIHSTINSASYVMQG